MTRFVACLLACAVAGAHAEDPNVQRPRNVIFIVGDGMGLSHISAASLRSHGPEGGLALESMPTIGLVRTWASDHVVTDSAAAATALASGIKTYNGAIGVDPSGTRVPTLAETASARGMAVGLVTTTFVFDATTAAYASHAASRKSYVDILTQMIDSHADFIAGGDFEMFENEDDRSVDLRQVVDRAPSRGRTVSRSLGELDASSGRVIVLFPIRDDSPDAFGPPLPEVTRVALDRLSQDPDGFFLVLESEEPDEGSHVNSESRMLNGVMELDGALRLCLEFAGSHPDTLILVTADHECGGLALNPTRDPQSVQLAWTTKDHTSQWVPIFAIGPGAERFGGVIDNTDIAHTIDELMGFNALVDAGR